MEQLIEDAVMKDAPTKSRKEEFVCGMGRNELPKKSAVMKDALTKSNTEESALDMVQHQLKRPAAMMDAPTMPREEESVGGMEQSLPMESKNSGGKDAHRMIKMKCPVVYVGQCSGQ